MAESYLYPDQWIAEETTWHYTRVITDDLGQPISSSQLTTLTVTLYEVDSGTEAIINGLDQVNVKNVNQGTVNASGVFTFRLRPEDTVILDAVRRYERRRLLLQWTYASGAKARSHEIDLVIRAVSHVPA